MFPSSITNPITVRDSDLTVVREKYSSVHVWYYAFGQRCQTKICGHRFFEWLPEIIRMQHGSIDNYWYTVDPEVRDTQVAEYIHATSNLVQLAAA